MRTVSPTAISNLLSNHSSIYSIEHDDLKAAMSKGVDVILNIVNRAIDHVERYTGTKADLLRP